MGVQHTIRLLIMSYGKTSPMEVYRFINGKIKYESIRRIFNVLTRLGLIRPVERVVNSKGSPIYITYYTIVEGKEKDPCWDYMWPCYWCLKGKPDRIPLSIRLVMPDFLRKMCRGEVV